MSDAERAAQFVALIHVAGRKLVRLAQALEAVEDWQMDEATLQLFRRDAQSIAQTLIDAL